MSVIRKFLLISQYKSMFDVVKQIFNESNMCDVEGIDNYEIEIYYEHTKNRDYDVIIIDETINPLMLKEFNAILLYILEFNERIEINIDIDAVNLYEHISRVKVHNLNEYITKIEYELSNIE